MGTELELPQLSEEEFRELLESFTEKYKDYLPYLLIDIWEQCDKKTALLLWRNYAGKSIYIPIDNRNKAHPIYQLVGKESMFCLTQNWGGSREIIPKSRFLCQFNRNRNIVRLYRKYYNYSTVARKMREDGTAMAVNTIRNIVRLYSSVFKEENAAK